LQTSTTKPLHRIYKVAVEAPVFNVSHLPC